MNAADVMKRRSAEDRDRLQSRWISLRAAAVELKRREHLPVENSERGIAYRNYLLAMKEYERALSE